jgi:hypothetical protein
VLDPESNTLTKAEPQQSTLPPATTAHEWSCPALTVVAPASLVTATGDRLDVLVPSPSCPAAPSPQQTARPDGASTAHVSFAPALTIDGVSAAYAGALRAASAVTRTSVTHVRRGAAIERESRLHRGR